MPVRATVVPFEREKTILQAFLTDRASFLVGFDGVCNRFVGR
jgi:hypothetical protein